ncbi:UBX domain-containing protein 2A-like [Acipenser oxyrinchus oxyrinchus]|uniref:UBX domain-containing protein 2A-like n=1 Tax=Acipenser oxyrinchus oxyrinchus TaxID=40147 RepID=A0AAD8LP78_ACIOX|nr:UBX domain-containing protein 2A-like [Acipenser oxyrinchus oxyrinchus]
MYCVCFFTDTCFTVLLAGHGPFLYRYGVVQKAEVVKLWKNGFTVNDGGLRSYTDAADQKSLESIKRGQLDKAFTDKELEVKDCKNEVYMPTQKEFHPFTKEGYRLGR